MALLISEYQDLNRDHLPCSLSSNSLNRIINLNKLINDSLNQTYTQCEQIGVPYDLSLKDVESLLYHNIIVNYIEQKKLNLNYQIEYFFKKQLVNNEVLPFIRKVFKILHIKKESKPKNFIKKIRDFAKTYNLRYIEDYVLVDCTNKLALLK